MGKFFWFLIVGYSIIFLWLLVRLSHWRRLHKKYRSLQPPPPEMQYLVSGYVGQIYYRNSLNIGVSDRGLYLGTFFPFNLLFSPLFIPWAEINKITKTRSFGHEYYRLEINIIPLATVRLPQHLLRPLNDLLLARMEA